MIWIQWCVGFILLILINLRQGSTATMQHAIPVLCFHNIKPDIKTRADYNISPQQFRAQIKMLADSGYHSILPDQLYNYLTTGAPLPPKPILLSFDDTHEEHYSLAAPMLEQSGFKGVFFIMTVCINRPHYMTAEQIKQLSVSGHAIACHTWNHPDVRKLTAPDWEIQVTKAKQRLEQITGKPIEYFAYPYGLWSEAAIQALQQHGIKAAFQLTGRNSTEHPLYTIRRQVVPGNWSTGMLNKEIHTVFK